MKRVTVGFLITLIVWLAACGGTPPAAPEEPVESVAGSAGVMVTEPFANINGPNGAVYMTLMNNGSSDDALIKAQASVADAVELHQTKMGENDMMMMSPVERIDVPAGGSAALEPGSFHVMLIGVQDDLTAGDTFNLTLDFESGESQTVEVKVSGEGTMGSEMEHDMDHNMDQDMDQSESN